MDEAIDKERSEAFRESQRATIVQTAREKGPTSQIKQGRKRLHSLDKSRRSGPRQQLARPNRTTLRQGLQGLRANQSQELLDPLSQAIV